MHDDISGFVPVKDANWNSFTEEQEAVLRSVLEPIEGLMIKDNLSVDRTFSVIAPKDMQWSLRPLIDLYTTVETVLRAWSITAWHDQGFIESDDMVGFWIMV